VVWYTFGVTRFVRPEDYPVMPCDTIGFSLKPVGFFEANPALVSAPHEADRSASLACVDTVFYISVHVYVGGGWGWGGGGHAL
jgi:hypothetical protein